MKTLEEHFGQTIRVMQASIADLVAGPRLAYGVCIGLRNFSKKLNTGDIEREANITTNLKHIVCRFPNDLIIK